MQESRPKELGSVSRPASSAALDDNEQRKQALLVYARQQTASPRALGSKGSRKFKNSTTPRDGDYDKRGSTRGVRVVSSTPTLRGPTPSPSSHKASEGGHAPLVSEEVPNEDRKLNHSTLPEESAVNLDGPMNASDILVGFGFNQYSQLGDGGHSDCAEPMPLLRRLRDTYADDPIAISRVVASHFHTLLISTTGDVWSWGRNSSGECGIDVQAAPLVTTPERITALAGMRVVTGACGASHSVVVTDRGKCFAFGDNRRGQLGAEGTDASSPDIIQAAVPTLVDRLQEVIVTSVACGFSHTMFLTKAAELYACGDNEVGQLGLGEVSAPVRQPRLVERLRYAAVEAVVCGDYHTVCLTEGAKLWTWGEGKYGRLGNGSEETQASPWPHESPAKFLLFDPGPIVGIAAGGAVTALVYENALVTCGQGYHGQLGHGANSDSNVFLPVRLPSDVRVREVAVGEDHMICIVNKIQDTTSSDSPEKDDEAAGPRRNRRRKVKKNDELQVFAWGRTVSGRLGLGLVDCVDAAQRTPAPIVSLQNLNLNAVATRGATSFVYLRENTGVKGGIMVEQRPVDPSRCVLEGDGLKGSIAGVEGRFLVQLRDKDGMNCRAPDADDVMDVNVEIYGPGPCRAIVTKGFNGMYDVSYTGTVAGEYMLEAKYGDHTLGSGNIMFTVGAALPSAANSAVEGPRVDGTKAVVGKKVAFIVNTRDRFGNIRKRGGGKIQLSYQAVDGGSTRRGNVTDKKNGSYECAFTPKQPGAYVVSIDMKDGSIPGTPIRVIVEDRPLADRPPVHLSASMMVASLVGAPGRKCIVQDKSETIRVALADPSGGSGFLDRVELTKFSISILSIQLNGASGELEGFEMLAPIKNIEDSSVEIPVVIGTTGYVELSVSYNGGVVPHAQGGGLQVYVMCRLVHKYWRKGDLGIDERLYDGFYDVFTNDLRPLEEYGSSHLVDSGRSVVQLDGVGLQRAKSVADCDAFLTSKKEDVYDVAVRPSSAHGGPDSARTAHLIRRPSTGMASALGGDAALDENDSAFWCPPMIIAQGSLGFLNDVVVLNAEIQPGLRAMVNQLRSTCAMIPDEETRVRVCGLAVSNALGGQAAGNEAHRNDIEMFAMDESKAIRNKNGSVIMPLGEVRWGTMRHRALLFKYLCDVLELCSCSLKRRRWSDGMNAHVMVWNEVNMKDGLTYGINLYGGISGMLHRLN